MKKSRSVYVGFRCPKELKDNMIKYAKSQRIDLSHLIRKAVTMMFIKQTNVNTSK